jgi:hypothetical protein
VPPTADGTGRRAGYEERRVESFLGGRCRPGGPSGPVLSVGSRISRHGSDGTIGGEDPSTCPYLARQMLDSRLRRPKKGSNSGACTKNSISPAYQLVALTA